MNCLHLIFLWQYHNYIISDDIILLYTIRQKVLDCRNPDPRNNYYGMKA